jgi:hypothetical protein
MNTNHYYAVAAVCDRRLRVRVMPSAINYQLSTFLCGFLITYLMLGVGG